MKLRLIFPLVLFVFLLAGCTSQQISKTIGILTDVPLTKEEAANALKQALVQGITKGTNSASKVNGYLNNPLIKIPFPEDAEKVANTLRDIGLGKEVDKFVTALNHGAEEAAKEALPIFKNSIRQMTFNDAMAILKNDNKVAATDFLRRTTTNELTAKFSPIMERALQKTNATKFYGELVDRYNRIPLVKKADPDLNNYATSKAILGLFKLVEKEEINIRENISARTSTLMKKAFAAQD